MWVSDWRGFYHGLCLPKREKRILSILNTKQNKRPTNTGHPTIPSAWNTLGPLPRRSPYFLFNTQSFHTESPRPGPQSHLSALPMPLLFHLLTYLIVHLVNAEYTWHPTPSGLWVLWQQGSSPFTRVLGPFSELGNSWGSHAWMLWHMQYLTIPWLYREPRMLGLKKGTAHQWSTSLSHLLLYIPCKALISQTFRKAPA
jgi:hypothetical protein